MGQSIRRMLLLTAAGLALTAPLRGAQAQAATGDQATAPAPQLEEITVTARRRNESQQKTPVAVSAISGATLERLNIVQPTEFSRLIPNLSLDQGNAAPWHVAISIRGIGNQESYLTIDSPVGVYSDGVYLGRNTALNMDLVDLERVEVLKGPQGTLFGRNTSGGAVNLVTKAPTDEFGASEKAGWGQYEGWYTKTEVNTGEIGETGLKAIIAFRHADRDGFVDNPYSSDADGPGSFHSSAVWAKVHGEWDKLRADYVFDYDTVDAQTEGFQLAGMGGDELAYFSQSAKYGGDPLILSPVRRDPLPLYNYPTQPGIGHSATIGHALTLQYDLDDDLTLKSISAYRHWYAQAPSRFGANYKGPVLDPATGAVSVQQVSPFWAFDDDAQYQFSQELQVLGKADRFTYIGGLFYFYEHVRENNPTFYTFPLSPDLGINLNSLLLYRGMSSSVAAYGQTSYTPPILDDKVELTGGLRYTIDHRSIDLLSSDVTGSHDFYNFAFNFSAKYQFTSDINAYMRISSGYRSGGFNARQTSFSPTDPNAGFLYQPEKAIAYEIGLKSEFFDRRLRANVAGFYTDYSDLQVGQYTGNVGTTANADANLSGFEIEVQALPTEELSIDASVGYVNPVYTKFPHFLSVPTPGSYDISSIAKFPYVPDWTTHIGVQYTFPSFSFGTFAMRADYSFQSERYFFTQNLPLALTNGASNPYNNLVKDPGQNQVSARLILSDIPLGAGGSTAEVQIYGENLLDQDMRDGAVDFGALNFAGINFGMPRSFGFDVTIKY